jgi:hypothetical protein
MMHVAYITNKVGRREMSGEVQSAALTAVSDKARQHVANVGVERRTLKQTGEIRAVQDSSLLLTLH